MKIAVIGYSGAGKSTLAKRLSERYQEPVLYLDTVHWLPGWVERPSEESQRLVEEFLNQNDGWVIDGSYGKLHFTRRLEEADEIVFLNFNRWTCLYRALKRNIQYKGKTRESMTEGCPERMSGEFLWWLIYSGRVKRRRDKFKKLSEMYAEKWVEIKTEKQLDAYMGGIKEKKE